MKPGIVMAMISLIHMGFPFMDILMGESWMYICMVKIHIMHLCNKVYKVSFCTIIMHMLYI